MPDSLGLTERLSPQADCEIALNLTDSFQNPSVQILNSQCFCIHLDTLELQQAVEHSAIEQDLYQLIQERNPHIFSSSPVFISMSCVQRMAALIQAVEATVSLPAYREEILARSPEIAQFDSGVKGVFYGYDFHLNGEEMGLIEINTNAGGAMLNLVLSQAQRACCPAVASRFRSQDPGKKLEQDILAMFESEWRAAGKTTPLRTIAIVDESPKDQYLYSEFLLFQRLFRRHGLEAIIADPAELSLSHGSLVHTETGIAVDFLYNRLTDFMLEQEKHRHLRQAYLERAVVLSPHPAAHALYADKRNLTLLSDPEKLRAWRVPEATAHLLLAGIPRTLNLTPANAETLWQQRRQLFFKPNAGFGSRAAYRGDKLTKRVWDEIRKGNYVAQQLVPPGERVVRKGEQALKFDIRCYVYRGKIQWIAARLYQGQTTNFRTPGGGFAPVHAITTENFIDLAPYRDTDET